MYVAKRRHVAVTRPVWSADVLVCFVRLLCGVAADDVNEAGGHHCRFKYGDFRQPLNATEQAHLRIRATMIVGTTSDVDESVSTVSDSPRNPYVVEWGASRASQKDTWSSDFVNFRFEALWDGVVVETYVYEYLAEDNNRAESDLILPFVFNIVPPANVSHLIPAVAMGFTFCTCTAHGMQLGTALSRVALIQCVTVLSFLVCL